MTDNKNAHNNFITSDTYSTPKKHPRLFFDKMMFGGSFYFWCRFVIELLINRRLSLAGKFDTHTWAKRSMDIFQLIENCGGRFHIKGLDNINKSTEPVVFVSNHMSMLESMIFPGLIASRRNVTFVVKQSLVTHPIFGPVMRSRKPITVSRHDPMTDFKKVLLDGCAYIKDKTSVVIFPQSQRMVQFDPQQFNTLGVKLAKKSKVQVIPVAVKTDFWNNGRLIKDIGIINRKMPIHIEFGEAITVEGAGKKEHQLVIDFITGRLNEWSSSN